MLRDILKAFRADLAEVINRLVIEKQHLYSTHFAIKTKSTAMTEDQARASLRIREIRKLLPHLKPSGYGQGMCAKVDIEIIEGIATVRPLWDYGMIESASFEADTNTPVGVFEINGERLKHVTK